MITFYTVIQDNDRQLVAHRLISKDGTFEIDFDLLKTSTRMSIIITLFST